MNRLLENRLTDACESVDRTNAALTKASNRRVEAEKIRDRLRDITLVKTWMEAIETAIGYGKNIGKEIQREDVRSRFEEKIQKAHEGLEGLKESLEQMMDWADCLNRISLNAKQLESHKKRTTGILLRKTKQLGRIREDAQKGESSPQELLSAFEKNKPIWGEHIESVAGMVLRDQQFDDGLCALADYLIEICRGYAPFATTETFNILGREREHAILEELKYTLYFCFPSWSVWGLPLVAHEFWHASSDDVLKDSEMQEFTRRISRAEELWKGPEVQDCLADAFATFVIGPAYAFTCIVLVLAPERHRRRADTVFATLDYLAKDKTDAPAYDFATELKASWDEACGAHATSLAEAGEIKALRDAVLSIMPPALRYNAPLWFSQGENLVELLERKADGQEWKSILKQFSVPEGLDLRHVLHAAWWKRWNSAGASPSSANTPANGGSSGGGHTQDEELDRIKKLAGRAAQLCHKVADQRRKPPIVIDDDNGPGSRAGLAMLKRRG
jgi:hypothetical protein